MFKTQMYGLVFLTFVYGGLCSENVENYDKNYYEFKDVIERPCPSFDLYCIRQYFATHSDCKIAVGPVPDPLYFPQKSFFIPSTNISVTSRNFMFRNLNGIITEFYVNKLTDLVVLAVEYRNARDNNFITVRFHRTGKEPATTNSNLNEFYTTFTITTVFRGVQHLRLEESESHIFFDTLPSFTIEPSIAENPDPNVPRMFAEFISQAPVSYQEAYLTFAPKIVGNYIQYNICDFGLKLF